VYSPHESSGTQPCPTRWEHLEHGADIGVRGCGPAPETAFEQAAVALTAIVCAPQRIGETRRVTVRCEAPDLELLFYRWLNAVIYEMDTRRMLFRRYEVTIRDGRLSATLHGEPLDPDRHRPAVEPKGATFTALRVARDAQGCWCAQCVIDV
jgi:tRNA nucleotidyltransferase (CCA-adding enzyme)